MAAVMAIACGKTDSRRHELNEVMPPIISMITIACISPVHQTPFILS
jgi:hypothetical protein